MITEDYVSFETAKLLEEKGFAGECSRFYMPSGHGRWKYEHYHDFDISDRIECPTLQMAMKWLREVHNIHISIYVFNRDLPVGDKALYTCDIATKEQSSKDGHLRLTSDTYEEACESGIKYCLENLI